MLHGSSDGRTAARHVLAAACHTTGTVLATTDVDAATNEITRLRPLLDQIDDLRGVAVTADALHCQRDHVTYLSGRGAHCILTVKGNQPHLHAQPRTSSTGSATSPTPRTDPKSAPVPVQVMAALRNTAIGVLRLAGVANIAAATRYGNRPLDLLKIG